MMSYVCVLSTDNYLEGVLVLNENLKHLNSKYNLLCLINEKISEETRDILDYFKINYKVLKSIEYDHSKNENEYWKYTFDKLNIFSLIEYEKIVYLDIDLLILENIDNLFEINSLSMPLDLPFRDDYFNSGIIVLKPNIEDYNNLVKLAFESNQKGRKISDQNIINEYFTNINILPIKYNVTRSIYDFKGDFFEDLNNIYRQKYAVQYYNKKVNDIKIIHYIGKLKPFMLDDLFDDMHSFLYSYYLNLVRNKENRFKLMKSETLISIIITIYNDEKNLKRCLDSIVSQTYRNLEIILINDCSTDSSLEICNEYKDSRIKIINNDKKIGISSSNNIGLSISKGDYIAFVSSSCYVEDNTFEILLKNIINYNLDFVQAGAYIGNNKIKSCYNNMKYFINNQSIIDAYLSDYYITDVVWDKIFKKEIVKNKKFDINYETNSEMKFIFDVLTNSNQIGFIDDLLFHYLINNKKDNINQEIDFLNTIYYIEDIIESKYSNSIDLFYNFVEKRLMQFYDNINYDNLIEKEKQELRDINTEVKKYIDKIINSNKINIKLYDKLLQIINNYETNFN